MFTVNAAYNPYLRLDQNHMQAVLSVKVDQDLALAPAPLSLAIALDCSGSMEGIKLKAAREGAIQVVQALDSSMQFVVVAFNNSARVVFGPAMASDENKLAGVTAIQRLAASGGTCMSTALNLIVDQSGNDPTRASKILLLTDGKNEGELRPVLNRAIARCGESGLSISAWGVGLDWDERELRYMADQTRGQANIIPTPKQVATAFLQTFSEMRKTALTNTQLVIWSPAGVSIKSFQQVYPNIVSFQVQPDQSNPRQHLVTLGSFSAGEQRDYLLDLDIPVYAPGQQFVMLRPTLKYIANRQVQEEKTAREAWVFAQWSADTSLTTRIDPQIAHYTHQEELARQIQEGQEALAQGNKDKATRLLGRALALSQQTNNEAITQLLSNIVLMEPNGTVRLKQADAVARKTLAINVGRTTKLN